MMIRVVVSEKRCSRRIVRHQNCARAGTQWPVGSKIFCLLSPLGMMVGISLSLSRERERERESRRVHGCKARKSPSKSEKLERCATRIRESRWHKLDL